MELYWDWEEAEILILTLLDPRIKSLDFVGNEEICNSAKELLERKYVELKDDSTLENINQTLTTFPSTQLGKKSLLLIFEWHSLQHENEVTIYLSLPEMNIHSDPFIW
ncbi:hypothetical protein RclHR1_10880007 [Rhizophagus clarus]|nr:hypothetical protein RclHR1_10880007 [Rhizophagus clarus]